MRVSGEGFNQIIDLEPGKDFRVKVDNQIKVATRIMKGQVNNRYSASKEDSDKANQLIVLTSKGDKEAEYQLCQLNREINEGIIIMALSNIKTAESTDSSKDNKIKQLIRRKMKEYNKKAIQRALERVLACRNRMGILGEKLGKDEIFKSEINIDELAKEFDVK